MLLCIEDPPFLKLQLSFSFLVKNLHRELIAGKTLHRRKITRTIMMSREQNMNMEETEVGRVRKKLKRLMDKKQEDPFKSKTNLTVAAAVSAVTKQIKKGGATSFGVESNEILASEAGLVQELSQGLDAGLTALTISGVDDVDSGVNGEAVVSAMPLPTEETAGVLLPKLGLRRGSFYKKLME